MTRRSATAHVYVTVDPLTAFAAFTDEIDSWWVRGPINFFNAARAVGMRIEPGVGGRILEVYDEDALELARITIWEPGKRLVYSSSVDDTETEVRFDAVDGGTRVRVEQYLLPGGERAFLFWPTMAHALSTWCSRAPSITSGGTVTTPDPTTAVVPMLAYEDGPAAIDWLADAFGFIERTRVVEEGRLTHGEMQAGRGLIMLATPTRDYEGPRRHREHCDAARAWSAAPFVIDGVMVRVEDIDTHYKRAEGRGAVMLSGIETAPPGRLYRAEDIEGHRWMFLQPH